MKSESIKTIYLIAICGTGMASLAGLLKEAGYQVTGSDGNIYPPMSTLLEDLGIPVKAGYKRENITSDIDLVVVGNAVSKTNEEVQEVLAQNIPYTSFPQALSRFFLEGRKSLVVTGTHGKTTTTSMLSWVLETAGKEPGFMVGGWLNNFQRNYKVPGGDYFVTEGDEYDTAYFDKGPKFLHYQPHSAILTSIEFDHADIFNSLEEIEAAFEKFVSLIPTEGFLLVEHTVKTEKKIWSNVVCKLETYGFDPSADWSVGDYRFEGKEGCFQISRQGQSLGEFRLPMVGRHNALNATAVTALAINCGIPLEEVRSGLNTFRGVKRRQEIVGEEKGVLVIDDFAHHPTAIHLTVSAIKEAFPDRRLWAVFEPRSATSRRNVLQEPFAKSFGSADKVILAGLHAPEKIAPEDRFDPEGVVQTMEGEGTKAWYIPEVESIVDFLGERLQVNDVVLIMSSGGFYGIHQKLLNRLAGA